MSSILEGLGLRSGVSQDQRIINHCKGICGELQTIPTNVRMPQEAIDGIKLNNQNVLKCRQQCISTKREELRKKLAGSTTVKTPLDVERVVQETLQDSGSNGVQSETQEATNTVQKQSTKAGGKTMLILAGVGIVAYVLLKK